MVGVMFWLAIVALGYGAYRIIGGGFRSSQSEKLNAFGIIGYVIATAFVVWLATEVYSRFF